MSPRKSATWPRASPDGTWKNRLPASEIATAASPAVLKTCIWISRDSPDSAAPCASDARRAWTHRDAARPRLVPRASAAHAACRWPRAVGRARRSRRRPAARARRRRGRVGMRVPPALLVGHALILPCSRDTPRNRADLTPRAIHQSCFARDRHLRRDDPQQARRRRGRGGRRGPRRPRRGRRRRRRRRPPRLGRRGRAGGQPPVRVHPQGLRRVALVRDGRPRLAAASRHRRRDRAGPRRRGDRGARVGALPRAAPARRHVARRPAAGRRRRPAAGPDVLLRRRPARQPTTRPRSGRSPRTSASAGSARCHPRVATSRPSAGPTATAARTRRWPRARPTAATRAASWSGSPARWPTRSASAPTATPTTTAGS